MGGKFEVIFGRAASEICNKAWNLGKNSTFDIRLRKTPENLERFGRPQDLPDAGLLTSSQLSGFEAHENYRKFLYV